MSSITRKLSKRVSGLRFPEWLYGDTGGSFLICQYIFDPNKHPIKWYVKQAKKITQEDIEQFRPDYDFPVVACQSSFNLLFCPRVNGELYPIREDGVFSQTAKRGKIIEIDWYGDLDEEAE